MPFNLAELRKLDGFTFYHVDQKSANIIDRTFAPVTGAANEVFKYKYQLLAKPGAQLRSKGPASDHIPIGLEITDKHASD